MKRFRIQIFTFNKTWLVIDEFDTNNDAYKEWCNINANKLYKDRIFRLIEVVENILEIKNPK